MENDLLLRDHSQPCKHKEAELWHDGMGKGRDWWACGYYEADEHGEVLYECPGGRKIELVRAAPGPYWHEAHPDRIDGGDTSTWFYPVESRSVVLYRLLWVSDGE